MDGKELAKNALDEIPKANADAKQIVGLVKENGKITGYKLSDETFVAKPQAVQMAKQGDIKGVGVATEAIRNTLNPSPTEAKTIIWVIFLPFHPKNKKFPRLITKSSGE